MADDDLLTQWALLLVSSLEELGVCHAVLSPGSRSTPLTWAFSQSARIEHHLVIDERSAAFFALGQAKQSAQPQVLVCTSGSAAANYFPAIVEASQSYTPLLVLTADRPFELQHCDAPQTIDQVKLYGDFVRQFFDLGMPDGSLGSLRALRRTISQAVSLCTAPTPGPVHVNFRARKPLEPLIVTDSPLAERVRSVRASPLPRSVPARLVVESEALSALAQRCLGARRGLITIGPRAPSSPSLLEPLRELLAVCELSILAESTSQVRHATHGALPADRICDGFDWLYSTQRGQEMFAPDFVLQVGPPPTSGAWLQVLSQTPQLDLHVLQEHGWPDPSSRASTVLRGALAPTLSALAQQIRQLAPKTAASTRHAPTTAAHNEPAREAATAWHQKLALANHTVWQAVDVHLKTLNADATLAEPQAISTLMNALPTGALLTVGNSLPVREIDLYCRRMSKDLRVLSQRGANGIDGLISGAAGAASLHDGPTVCLLGDISFLHDVGGLWAARGLTKPFVVVALNNGGGRIFEQLPLLREGSLSPETAAAWLTPHALRLDWAGRLFGLTGQRVEAQSTFLAALNQALAHPGATLLDVQVEASSAQSSRTTLLGTCEAALQGALHADLPGVA